MINLYESPQATTIGKYKEKLLTLYNNLIENEEMVGHFYIGYPTPRIESENLGEFLALLVIENYGIFAFWDNEERQKLEERFLINSITKFNDLYREKDRYVKYINTNDIELFIEKNLNFINDFSNELFKKFISSIQGIYGMRISDERPIKNSKSLGSDIKKRNEALKILDKEQYKMIHSDIESHIRIRGLAGSGKTIIMTQKMAQLHFYNPDKVIVYTYMTKSLGEFIRKLFEAAYHELTNESPNYENVKIMHAWGSYNTIGLYREICLANNIMPQPLKTNGFYNSFDSICLTAKNGIKNQLYDYIFIDEAQDFPFNFFQLAKASLKNAGKFIYAYDEMQILNKNSVPSKSRIFGRMRVEDINLEKSYRTPLEILVGAHAIGLGINNISDDGKVRLSNFVEDDSVWETVGYSVKPNKPKGNQQVTMTRLYRNDEKSSDKNGLEIVKFYGTDSFDDQIKITMEEISKLMEEEEVIPEDILIIDLDSPNYKVNFQKFRMFLWKKYNNKFSVNLVDEDSNLTFRIKGSMPYTSINRSKGNEAAIVYLLNGDANSSSESYWRRKIFTAMTRSKHLVRILGSKKEIIKLEDEYKKIKNDDFILSFLYPTKEEKKNIFNLAESDENDENQIDKSVQVFDKIRSNSFDKALELLARQLGVKKDDLPSEVVELVKKGSSNHEDR